LITGYLHPQYAASLSEWGTPHELTHCGGWILERPIPKIPTRDAMGCYPLFACQDWSQLHRDLDEIDDELVSLALVTDPFGKYEEENLRQCFRDVVIPFKKHYIINLQMPLSEIGSKHNRKHARRALRTVQVQVCENPTLFIETWSQLYSHLIKLHHIEGIRAFSKTAFIKQLAVPGIVVLQAIHEGEVVGAQLYYQQDEMVYCHLGAANPLGYQLGAVYALDWYSIEYFSGKAQWLDLGGGAGITRDGILDGLSQYKQRWSNETRTAYFCGRIINPTKYAEIAEEKQISATSYFPAYRKGEFV
jgi:hypothetical protein